MIYRPVVREHLVVVEWVHENFGRRICIVVVVVVVDRRTRGDRGSASFRE
jgi:hypothetical protein